MRTLSVLGFAAKNTAVKTIRLYQKTLSLDHGLPKFLYPHGYCKFNPSCSQYAIDAINAFGLIRGGLFAAWRVLRCHPFSRGGLDPIEKINN